MRKRLTYGNVIGTIALFVALGGSSYAALRIPSNSVGNRQLKNLAVSTSKLRNGSVTGSKIRAYSLTRRLFAPGQLARGGRGPQGPRGHTGPQGPIGPTGPAGPASSAAWALVSATGSILASSPGVAAAPNQPGGNKFVVRFPIAATGHAISAVASQLDPTGGPMLVSPCGTTADSDPAACPVGSSANDVAVTTLNAGGGGSTLHAFYVAVLP